MNDTPLPGDYASLKPWFNVIRQAASVAHTGGAARIAFKVWVDDKGKPIFWERPTVTEVMPRNSSQTVTNYLTAASKSDIM